MHNRSLKSDTYCSPGCRGLTSKSSCQDLGHDRISACAKSCSKPHPNLPDCDFKVRFTTSSPLTYIVASPCDLHAAPQIQQWHHCSHAGCHGARCRCEYCRLLRAWSRVTLFPPYRASTRSIVYWRSQTESCGVRHELDSELTTSHFQAQKFIEAYSAFLKRQGKLQIPGEYTHPLN